jgi:hypothetical protein
LTPEVRGLAEEQRIAPMEEKSFRVTKCKRIETQETKLLAHFTPNKGLFFGIIF